MILAPLFGINLTSVILALAPVVLPCRIIPDATYPKNCVVSSEARDHVSTFKVVEELL